MLVEYYINIETRLVHLVALSKADKSEDEEENVDDVEIQSQS